MNPKQKPSIPQFELSNNQQLFIAYPNMQATQKPTNF